MRYTLLTDGPTDRVLLRILDWLLKQHIMTDTLSAEFLSRAEIGRQSSGFTGTILIALQRYPCDLLFVHRDAEKQEPHLRYSEIQEALAGIKEPPLCVCVVPVRMTEAWLLFDENAIRNAAGNPAVRKPLQLPRQHQIEELSDPKETLHPLLKAASPRKPRFTTGDMTRRIPDFIDSFHPLRGLNAFDTLEQNVKETITTNGW